MKRCNLMFVTTGLAQGGAEAMLIKLIETLDRERFDLVVICVGARAYNSAYLDQLKISTEYLNLQKWYELPKALYKAATLASKLKIDVVQGWMYHGNLFAQWISMWSRQYPPTILGIRQTIPTLWNGSIGASVVVLLDAMLSWRSTAQIFNSKQAIIDHAKFGYRVSRAKMIPNGFDVVKYHCDTNLARDMRSQLDLPSSAFVVGFFARFHPQKDFKLLIQSFAEFVRQMTGKDVRLVLAGTNINTSNKQLHQWLSEAGVLHLTTLLGPRSDIPALLTAIDVFCQTSKFGEGFPNAICEAMLTETICVATNVGETASIIGQTGIVVEQGDMLGIAAGLKTICSMESDAKKQLGAAARNRIMDSYELTGIANQYAALYETVLRHPKD